MLSKTSSLPPIPPNCPCFGRNQSGDIFFLPKMDSFWCSLDGFDDHARLPILRPMIAAIARCAFIDANYALDESWREIDAAGKMTEDIENGTAAEIRANDLAAAAWKKWGEK